MSIWVKICANTSLADALLAAEAGADAVGFVFAPSPRRVTEAAVAAITPRLPASLEKIGVFVDASLKEMVAAVEACGLTGVQLHFNGAPDLPAQLHQRLGPELRVVRVLRFRQETAAQHRAEMAAFARDSHVSALLVDAYSATSAGGTGTAFDWGAARQAVFQNEEATMRRIAAGGLNPANVAQAITELRPWGVDVVSGVEADPDHKDGRKDARKVREFVARARAAAQ